MAEDGWRFKRIADCERPGSQQCILPPKMIHAMTPSRRFESAFAQVEEAAEVASAALRCLSFSASSVARRFFSAFAASHATASLRFGG
jgi:hypothetical protein